MHLPYTTTKEETFHIIVEASRWLQPISKISEVCLSMLKASSLCLLRLLSLHQDAIQHKHLLSLDLQLVNKIRLTEPRKSIRVPYVPLLLEPGIRVAAGSPQQALQVVVTNAC